MSSSKTKYLASGVLAAIIWGFFAIPLRNLKGYPSEQILYYRIFTSLLVIWAAIFLFRRKELLADISYFKQSDGLKRRQIVYQIVGATILLVLNWYTFIYAINNVSIKSGAFAYMVCPLITAFGGFVILKEHLYKIQIVALGLATISILMLATGSLLEVTWSVVIAALYAFYLIIQRKMQGLDKLNVLAVQITISVIMMLPFFVYQHTGLPLESGFWLNIIIIAVLFTVFPLFLSLFALVGIPSSTLGIIIYINPIIAFAIAIIYFKEKIDPHQLTAYALLLFAVFLFNWNLIKGMITFKRN